MSLASAGTVSDGLLKTLASCKAEFDTFDDTPEVYRLEPGYGFAVIQGSYPTCGCSCSITAAAYQVADGSHRFLGREEWDCASTRGLTGPDWSQVLPSGLRSRLLPKAAKEPAPAVAVLDAQLPHKGTDTTLRLAMIPIGMEVSCPGRLCDRVSASKGTMQYLYFEGQVVAQLIEAGLSSADLEAFGRSGSTSLSDAGQAIVGKVIRPQTPDRDETLRKVQNYLAIALERWVWVQQLTSTALTLGWNRDQGAFEVAASQSTSAGIKTFLDYLRQVEGLQQSC